MDAITDFRPVNQSINQSNYHSNDGGEKIQSLRHPVSRGGGGDFLAGVC